MMPKQLTLEQQLSVTGLILSALMTVLSDHFATLKPQVLDRLLDLKSSDPVQQQVIDEAIRAVESLR